MTVVFRGHVRGGIIDLGEKRDGFKSILRSLEGRAIDLRLAPSTKIRSLPQNDYYWAVVVPIFAEFCGYDHTEMHNVLKRRFLPWAKSTAILTTAQFGDFIEHCRRLAAELGLFIPDPTEVEI